MDWPASVTSSFRGDLLTTASDTNHQSGVSHNQLHLYSGLCYFPSGVNHKNYFFNSSYYSGVSDLEFLEV